MVSTAAAAAKKQAKVLPKVTVKKGQQYKGRTISQVKKIRAYQRGESFRGTPGTTATEVKPTGEKTVLKATDIGVIKVEEIKREPEPELEPEPKVTTKQEFQKSILERQGYKVTQQNGTIIAQREGRQVLITPSGAVVQAPRSATIHKEFVPAPAELRRMERVRAGVQVYERGVPAAAKGERYFYPKMIDQEATAKAQAKAEAERVKAIQEAYGKPTPDAMISEFKPGIFERIRRQTERTDQPFRRGLATPFYAASRYIRGYGKGLIAPYQLKTYKQIAQAVKEPRKFRESLYGFGAQILVDPFVIFEVAGYRKGFGTSVDVATGLPFGDVKYIDQPLTKPDLSLVKGATITSKPGQYTVISDKAAAVAAQKAAPMYDYPTFMRDFRIIDTGSKVTAPAKYGLFSEFAAQTIFQEVPILGVKGRGRKITKAELRKRSLEQAYRRDMFADRGKVGVRIRSKELKQMGVKERVITKDREGLAVADVGLPVRGKKSTLVTEFNRDIERSFIRYGEQPKKLRQRFSQAQTLITRRHAQKGFDVYTEKSAKEFLIVKPSIKFQPVKRTGKEFPVESLMLKQVKISQDTLQDSLTGKRKPRKKLEPVLPYQARTQRKVTTKRDVFGGDVVFTRPSPPPTKAGFRIGMYGRYRRRLQPAIMESYKRQFGAFSQDFLRDLLQPRQLKQYDVGLRTSGKVKSYTESMFGIRVMQVSMPKSELFKPTKQEQNIFNKLYQSMFINTHVVSGLDIGVISTTRTAQAQRQAQKQDLIIGVPELRFPRKVTIPKRPKRPDFGGLFRPPPRKPIDWQYDWKPHEPKYKKPKQPPDITDPNPNVPAPPPLFEFDYDRKKKKKTLGKGKRRLKYQPSLVAIKGEMFTPVKPQRLTGLEVRRIVLNV